MYLRQARHHTDKIIFLLLLPLRWSVVVIGETELEPCGCSPHEFRLLGQVDRYRTCTLRCWNTRRGVQTRPAASSRYVVSFVISYACGRAHGDGRLTNWTAPIWPARLRAIYRP